MNKKTEFLRIPVGPVEGLFEVFTWKGEINHDAPYICPCCNEALKAGMDICQWGMFEDSYVTYLICLPCGKAYRLDYTVPTYTIFGKREQKRLFPSKKPAQSAVSEQSERGK